ncbi:unnamed protein product [Fraxinus pennsylvanica]|uniref:GDSL esterase/lipase n=1 Tax=Fraxinus pennsylvanica TaxID=56036 RepID=A0AAD2AGU0_9LAMI|nr:unnamed protein product [Fraxinus pennsylvanica]
MAFHSIALIFIFQFQQILGIDAKISSIIVFGDSSVDSGNNNFIPTISRSDFVPYGRDFEGGRPTGRFSNGRIATDFISEAFGLKPTVPAYLDPAYTIEDFVSGVSFASAGTGFDSATSTVLSVIPLWQELEYYKEYKGRLEDYLGNKKAKKILTEALYIISMGTNDFLENYYVLPIRYFEFSPNDYQKFLVDIARSFITDIYHLGARKISLTGLPPMGCLPLQRTLQGGNCEAMYNHVAMEFNKKLKALVETLNDELSGIQLVFSNPYHVFSKIIQDPRSFGFQTAVTACCGTGTFEMGYQCNEFTPFTCTDANQYVFWDSFHPTEKTNFILADYAVKTSLAIFK